MDKKLAILTPTYNRSFTLERVYKSLLNQTSKNFVWYIIDDGSVDDSKQKIEAFIEENIIPIKYVFKDNGGKHSALNKGVEVITESYVAILDSDDALTEDAVETVLKDLDNIVDDDNLCGISYLRKDLNGNVIGKKFTKDRIVDTFVNQRYNKNTYGDKFEVFKLECLREFPFVQFEGENFLSETIVWSAMSGKYKMVFINKALYICEYLEGGLSNNIRKRLYRNPKGASACYNLISNKQFKLKHRIKHTLLYIVYSKAGGKKRKEIISSSMSKTLCRFLYLFGAILFIVFRKRYAR